MMNVSGISSKPNKKTHLAFDAKVQEIDARVQ